jgi:hypothetical protein
MKTVEGQGFSFDMELVATTDGKVIVQEPGMKYKFEARPGKPVPAKFNGLGEGTITEMKAEVEVDVKRFEQPGGPGTKISFNASDVNADGAYVEFTGVFVRTKDGKRFPFRVLFGNAPGGGGTVTPAGPEQESPLMSKSVAIGTPKNPATVTTALYEEEDDVAVLKQ